MPVQAFEKTMQEEFREMDSIPIDGNFDKEMEDNIFPVIRNIMYSNYNEDNQVAGQIIIGDGKCSTGCLCKKTNYHTNCGAYKRNYWVKFPGLHYAEGQNR